jgi:uncharacterized protein (DUF305 family)
LEKNNMRIAGLGWRTVPCVMAVWACICAPVAAAQEMHHQHGAPAAGKAPVFVASTAKPFSALMNDAMAVMDDGMKRAPMNGVAEHDFVTMMIPHHQGAIDMAKGVLLYSKDPELRNLAQGIITEQQNEINVMLAWLQRYQAAKSRPAPKPITREE